MSHISCPVEPLRRLQSEFKHLADNGCDPMVAFVTLRRPVFGGDPDVSEEVSDEPYYNNAHRRYYNEVRRRGLYARDWGWELSGRNGDPITWRNLNKPIDENWSRQLAGWSVSDGFATMPGCERWQYVFLTSNEFHRFDKICKRAATLFGNTFKSQIVEWAFGPNRPNEANSFDVSGLWCDLVMHVALQRIPGVMLSTNAIAMDEQLFPIRCMEPGDWTKPDQPPVWVTKIEHFCTASVDCIDAMIANWPSQSAIPPKGAEVSSAISFAGLLDEVNEWQICSRNGPPLTVVDLSAFDDLPNGKEACEQAIVEAYRTDFDTIARRLLTEFKLRGLKLSERILDYSVQSTSEGRKHEQIRFTALLSSCWNQLKDAMFASGELVEGWEPDEEWTFPDKPIRNAEELSVYVHELLSGLRVHLSERTADVSILAEVKRELCNVRRAMKVWGVPFPAEFDDNPPDIYEGERQLELLIENFTPTANAHSKEIAELGGKTGEANDNSPRPAKQKSKRGRPQGSVASDTNPDFDRRVYEIWEGGAYRTFDELGRVFGISSEQARLAKERHRDRLRKPGKIASPKARQEQ